MSGYAELVERTSADNSIGKAVSVLNALRGAENGAGARALASTTGLPRSTVQRLLASLGASGMVIQDEATQQYRIGPQALIIGLGYNAGSVLLAVARPHMISLRDEIGETVGLSVAVGDSRIFIDEVQSTFELRFASELGRLYPLWSGANGRLLLSDLADAEIERMLDSFTDGGLVHRPLSAQETWEQIRRIRRDGYAMASDEAIADVSSVSTPVRDAHGRITAALSASGPSERFTEERMNACLGPLRAASEAISSRVGRGSQY